MHPVRALHGLASTEVDVPRSISSPPLNSLAWDTLGLPRTGLNRLCIQFIYTSSNQCSKECEPTTGQLANCPRAVYIVCGVRLLVLKALN